MNSKDFNNDAEREGAADSTSAQGRPGQTFQGTGYQAPGYQNGPAFQGPGYHSNPGTYGQSGMDRFFNSIRAMNLYRAQPRVLGGVCSGISQRYGIDMTLVRILFIEIGRAHV